MGASGLIQRSTCAAALLAVALLAFAFTQSIVMQISGAAPGSTMAICTVSGIAHVNMDHGVPPQKASKACPFCAAASQAPLCALIAPIPQSSAVAWTAYTALRPLGPRGPPTFKAKARGPPQAGLTI